MTTQALAHARPNIRGLKLAARPTHPVTRARLVAAGIATVITAVLASAFIVAFGGVGLFVVTLSLPVPLLLLWTSVDLLRSDEVRG